MRDARTFEEINRAIEDWRDEQVAKLLAAGKPEAAKRLLQLYGGPFCWTCEVIEGRGYCGCPIAANE